MTIKPAPRVFHALGALLLLGIFAPVGLAAAKPPAKSIAADIPMEQRVAALQQLSQESCPQGFEHAMPGIYYYCVGIRDIARGKTDRARSMLEIAASWGSKQAQFVLGMGYYKGDVQPLDRGRGLAWLGLAAERQTPVYVAIFNSAWEQATPQERERGNALWKGLQPEYGDKHAARRAERRYRGERARMMANSAYGAQVCMAGSSVRQIDTGKVGHISDNQFSNDSTEEPNLECGQQAVEFVVHKMDHYADGLLDGWVGHVTVGPLQQAQAPSK